MSNHDGKCELLGGFHKCRCWLRELGYHPAMKSVLEWNERQNENDQAAARQQIELMNEWMHTVDRQQGLLRSQLRPGTVCVACSTPICHKKSHHPTKTIEAYCPKCDHHAVGETIDKADAELRRFTENRIRPL